MSCLYYRITNFNSIQDGYYKWTGCTGSVSITKIVPLFSVHPLGEANVTGTPTTKRNDVATKAKRLN